MQIAFYKAPGNLFDKAVRRWTCSIYSHCELVFSDGVFFSASPRDGGSRYKWIDKDPETWDFFELPLIDTLLENKIRHWCNDRVGRKYDWVGCFFGAGLKLNLDDPNRWFCSEICVAALQEGHMLQRVVPVDTTPGELYFLTS